MIRCKTVEFDTKSPYAEQETSINTNEFNEKVLKFLFIYFFFVKIKKIKL